MVAQRLICRMRSEEGRTGTLSKPMCDNQERLRLATADALPCKIRFLVRSSMVGFMMDERGSTGVFINELRPAFGLLKTRAAS